MSITGLALWEWDEVSFNDGFNIRSVPWPSNTPVSGNSLVYNGSQWVAADVSASGGGGSGVDPGFFLQLAITSPKHIKVVRK